MIAALVMAAVALLLGGCTDCRSLCNTLATELDTCLDERSLEWEDLGASSENNWAESCRDAWESVRADLEGREVSASLDQCGVAENELNDLIEEQGCDGLLALYGL